MVNGEFKDQQRRTTSEKVLPEKAFEMAINLKYKGYQRRIASMIYKAGYASTQIGRGISENQKLANKLHGPTRKGTMYIHLIQCITSAVLLLQTCS